MKFIAAALLTSLAGASAAFALEPVPGSITYGGAQPRLEQAPAGSNFFHTFYLNGHEVHEIYKVNADRSVALVSRTVAND
ncbi:hypothetical protein GVN24_04535 [Rhizobium sp. CRIBSB]|uniref:Uncharacterized protein n=1 Tax=Peteryoungia aggregata LMG 23059 TaxID=1368425 RepID=A0ABU0G7R3_9HYPH|nr:hypothetical protein [Peteryoungia aggregata]MDQ0421379.1 hypothetical protein [Peteryoungia aggregata LMG 23059]MDQ0422512.1 hypothetical protein [Peteryoungia aggregata LMG 23059]NBB47529.1 hypothetical protein [Rhizobium sp. CRIBSB]